MATATVFDPRDVLTRLGPAGQELREAYLQIDPSVDRLLDETVLKDSIRRSALFLEVCWISACVFESVELRGLRLDTMSPEEFERLVQDTGELTHVDVLRTMAEAVDGLPLKISPVLSPPPPFAAWIRAIRSMIVACPISTLEADAAVFGMEVSGHRCRVAYDGIQAFLLRCGDTEKDRAGIVGRRYVRGELTLDEAGRLLDLHPVDAVALLEAMDYARAVETIRLQSTDREQMLVQIRADRLRRQGITPTSHESIARDVIASERIEGIDARRWISREHG